MKHRTAIRFNDIDSSRLCEEAFIYFLLNTFCHVSEHHSDETIYEVLVPHLIGGPVLQKLTNEEQQVWRGCSGCVEGNAADDTRVTVLRGCFPRHNALEAATTSAFWRLSAITCR